MNGTHSSWTRCLLRAALAANLAAVLLVACGAPSGGARAPDSRPASSTSTTPLDAPALPTGAADAALAHSSSTTSLAASLVAVSSVFDPDEAMKLLSAIDPYYRVRGNSGYQRSLERIMLLLRSAGFAAAGGDPSEGGPRDTADFFDFGPVEHSWTPLHARLELVDDETRLLHSFEDESGAERTFVCVNSFPTRAEGMVAPLVAYDASKPTEVYAGTVVYGTEPAEALFTRAVQQGGALGVISSYLPEYNDAAGNPDSIRFATIPYDEQRHGFGLNVSRRSAEALEALLASRLSYVKVTIDVRFAEARGRTLVATVGGTQPGSGTIAVVGHLDEPGANDNGSGVAAMTAMAAGYLRAIRDGALPRPRRSVTFVFGAEFECSREWLKSAQGPVDLALVIDMAGEDQVRTGAVALIERMPDPGALWGHPTLDVHTEWGRSEELRESDLVGSFLNDYVMAAMRLRAEGRGWDVRNNPFEGGSDHESFVDRGIPAVLLWHFTDTYYHTSLDRLDKVDPAEMQHMAVAALALIHHFGNAGAERADEVFDIDLSAAPDRPPPEAANARRLLSAPAVAADAEQIARVSQRERAVVVAWSRWYREALLSIEKFDPDPTITPERGRLVDRIDQALHELRALEQSILDTI